MGAMKKITPAPSPKKTAAAKRTFLASAKKLAAKSKVKSSAKKTGSKK